MFQTVSDIEEFVKMCRCVSDVRSAPAEMKNNQLRPGAGGVHNPFINPVPANKLSKYQESTTKTNTSTLVQVVVSDCPVMEFGKDVIGK